MLITSSVAFGGCSTTDMNAVLKGVNQGIAQSGYVANPCQENFVLEFGECVWKYRTYDVPSNPSTQNTKTTVMNKGCDLDAVNRRAKASRTSSSGHGSTIESCPR